MAPVGRPRITTRNASRPPVNEIGVADPLNYGVGYDPVKGGLAPWHMWIDQVEYVPEWRWPMSVRTADQMRTDSQLAALTTAVMYGITQLRFIIDPNGARQSLVKEISQDLNLPIKGQDGTPMGRMKHRFSHHKFISQAMLSVIYGHMYFEELGTIIDGKWRLRKMAPRMPQTIQRINVAPDGGLVSIQQWAGNWLMNQGYPNAGLLAPEIPVDRLSAFIFQQEGFNWAGRPLIRDCFKDWVIKDRLLRVEAINHERAGGVPYANAPQGATPGEVEDLNQLMQQFRIGETSGAALPFGSDLKIAKGSGSDIDRTIKRYDEAMARRFLLQLMSLGQGGSNVGSYALSENFEDFFLVGQRAITQWYCDTVNEHIVEDIVDWNYGEDEEFVPKLTWERTREDSLGTEQLSMLVQRGVIVVDDEIENAIRYKYQLPKRTEPRGDQIVTPGGPRQPTQEMVDKNPNLIMDKGGQLPLDVARVDQGEPASAVGQGGANASLGLPDAGAQAGAPSSDAPATSTASFRLWDRLRGRRPDVAARQQDGPVLVTVPNIEILHAGIEYNLSTGPTTFTPEDLQDAVMAANEDPSIPNPRLKLGHVDPRFNDVTEFDATPSFGKATNLRLSENGMSVYADYVGVPKWLADIMPTAYPSRSIEGYWNVESQMGKQWRFVLSACSLLGVVWPGVTVLEDLPQYYGETMPSGVQVVAASTETTGGDPDVKIFGKKGDVAASANLDDVRRAFYNEYIPEHPDNYWWWIQAILVDPNELVVEDDETGRLFKIAFSSDADGNVSFDEPSSVKIEYVADTREANKAAASHVAAVLAVGREVAASWTTRADSRPANASGGAMDPIEIRKRLNLPEDASDEQVQETLKALNEAAGVEVKQEVPVVTPAAGDTAPESAPAATQNENGGEPAAAEAPAAVAAAGLPAGMVMIDAATLETLKVGASAGIEVKTRTEKTERENLVTAAIGDGRIAPKSREHWLNLLTHDPSAAATLESLAPGLIPMEMRELGHGGGGSEGTAASGDLDPETVRGWSGQLFPEVREMHRRDAAHAAGETPGRSRIVADASYRR